MGMYGRKITHESARRDAAASVSAGSASGRVERAALQASKEIILCESIIDALTFWCAGFRNVTASYGVNGFTDDHQGSVCKHGVKQVLGRLRPGRSRRRGGGAAKEELWRWASARGAVSEGHGCERYALKVTPASQSLAVLLNRTEKPPAVPAEPVP